MLRKAMGVGALGAVSFPGKKCYEGVMFNVISIMRPQRGGVKFSGKNRYVTLEWL